MISHLHSTTIAVKDQDAALDFYVNALGWEKGMDLPFDEGRWLTVVPPGAATHVVLADDRWEGVGGRLGGHTSLWLSTPDIDAAYATLSGRGVAFRVPASDMPWGQRATWFSDPDGNEHFLVEG